MFNLPKQTLVNRVVPKNSFDQYTNTKQKNLFKEQIQRMTWVHKISEDTVNLPSKGEVVEIQVFKIELKLKKEIAPILEIIDRAIPYPIVFWVEHGEVAYISTSAKHSHPTDENKAVVDWTFATDWQPKTDYTYSFDLKKDLEAVYKDFCLQISNKQELETESMEVIVQNQQEIDKLEKEIKKLKAAIKRSKQFNQKVELNMELNKVNDKLKRLTG